VDLGVLIAVGVPVGILSLIFAGILWSKFIGKKINTGLPSNIQEVREEEEAKDVEKVHELVTAAGLNTTNDEVHFLPFWENGVKFFTIEGPNKEKVEFSQYL
ncbi:MAG: hypothetical protein PUF40_01165, partial [Blautia massiliensis]|nr:hypothetical protein [Blautia massiliensis (ex Durand et al. 2017)]